ncbi:serine/threonine-protein kinase [Smaragdicoccus niigatensis]|uniref:serine/threonine-protein kinase n=1 Tax=Smaragdicoccus niigatensis TaxID=359359 RepID=UPI0003693A39|nr:serine/threonine-protein kinase [Smaragdicoccus niigatensis]
MTIVPGSVFAGYVVERRLGTGGMGSVYAARHPRLPRRVALKLLSEGLGSRAEFRARFEREAELAARLDHPNVVAVYDRGIEDDHPWIAMQLVDGMDVDQLLQSSPLALPPARAVFILSEAAKGLDHAHRHGLLHRDIKPANILVAEEVDDEDKVLVTDFGIARALDQTVDLTSAGSSPSTLPFASPEQIEGKTLDHRSDIYSLGCTLYVMLTGRRPFPRESALAVMNAHLWEPVPRPTLVNPGLPAAIDAVIAKAMAKNPADRYATCRQLAAAAAEALDAQPALRSGPVLVGGTGLPSDPSNPTYRPSDPAAPTYLNARPYGPPPAFDPTARRSDPSQPTPSAFALAHTIIPPRKAAPKGKRKWGILAAAGVTVGALVTGMGVLLTGHTTTAQTGKSVPAAATPTSVKPEAPAWGPFDFMVKALPGLMPVSPDATNYAGHKCVPIDRNFDETNNYTTVGPIGRLRCGEQTNTSDETWYVIACNADKTPWADLYFGEGVADVQTGEWKSDGQSGSVSVATYSAANRGIVGLTFDNPSRNFCQVWVYGGPNTTGTQVYDIWFPTAPLGDSRS